VGTLFVMVGLHYLWWDTPFVAGICRVWWGYAICSGVPLFLMGVLPIFGGNVPENSDGALHFSESMPLSLVGMHYLWWGMRTVIGGCSPYGGHARFLVGDYAIFGRRLHDFWWGTPFVMGIHRV
jgi:hypothetical protein